MTTITIPQPPSTAAFFDALTAADQHVLRHEQALVDAASAPPVTSYRSCSCGSVFEARDNRIELSNGDTQAAVEGLADAMGRGPMDDCDAQIVTDIVAAINRQRDTADLEAAAEWEDAHESCRSFDV